MVAVDVACRQYAEEAAFYRATLCNAARQPIETILELGSGRGFSISTCRSCVTWFAGNKNLQLRLEAFNAFNQPVWGEPNTSVIS